MWRGMEAMRGSDGSVWPGMLCACFRGPAGGGLRPATGARRYIRRSGPSRGRGDESVLGLLEELDDLLATHGGEALQELVDRIDRLEIVEEGLHGGPGAGQHR